VWLKPPGARLTFADEECRSRLASLVRDHDLDVVIVGPVTRSGMNEAGTLQEVRDFMVVVDDVRRRAGRHVTFILVHHENKGGQVSGAWEGAGDTLFHVQAQGNGRTRLYVQKARWASSYHATALNLIWTDRDGFEVEEKLELDDDALRDLILAAIREMPGTGWTKVETGIRGVRNDRLRALRDALLTVGTVANVVLRDGIKVAIAECPERQRAHLYPADDPTLRSLCPAWGADGAQPAPLWGANPQAALRPAPRPIRGAGVGAQPDTPPTDLEDGGAT
jgi:hypothetical protein